MIVRIIGCGGGVAPGARATSYLMNDELLIDAGSVAEGVSLERQVCLGPILISHAHLDHIKDLAFLCDNCLSTRKKPFEVYCNRYVRQAILKHLFNDVIWPDFSKIPSPENPIIRFHIIASEQSFSWGTYEITPVEVNHPGGALGFVIREGGGTLVFTQDTGPTERIWQVAAQEKNLKAIFTEASFPNNLASLASQSCHHSPKSLAQEIGKMPKDVPIYLGHLKPAFYEELQKEIQEGPYQMAPRRIHVLDPKGETLEIGP